MGLFAFLQHKFQTTMKPIHGSLSDHCRFDFDWQRIPGNLLLIWESGCPVIGIFSAVVRFLMQIYYVPFYILKDIITVFTRVR